MFSTQRSNRCKEVYFMLNAGNIYISVQLIKFNFPQGKQSHL
ncbi:hypothetical protein SP41_55 [Salmonella phage 41]|nr:hypothetical protein SP41_55 [Salmonella phage 41]